MSPNLSTTLCKFSGVWLVLTFSPSGVSSVQAFLSFHTREQPFTLSHRYNVNVTLPVGWIMFCLSPPSYKWVSFWNIISKLILVCWASFDNVFPQRLNIPQRYTVKTTSAAHYRHFIRVCCIVVVRLNWEWNRPAPHLWGYEVQNQTA